MIKLVKILSEIRNVGTVSPEKALEIIVQIRAKIRDSQLSSWKKTDLLQLLDIDLHYKYHLPYRTGIDQLKVELADLDKGQLVNLTSDLQKFLEKYSWIH